MFDVHTVDLEVYVNCICIDYKYYSILDRPFHIPVCKNNFTAVSRKNKNKNKTQKSNFAYYFKKHLFYILSLIFSETVNFVL